MKSSRLTPVPPLLIAVAFLLGVAGGCGHEFLDRSDIPSAARDLEEGSEQVFELVQAGRWTRAATRTTLLREITARFEAEDGRQFPELERSIAVLDRAIDDRDPHRATVAANDVFRQTIRIASEYLDDDAASILLLDAEAREVMIQAEADPTASDAAIRRINDLWIELRPKVEQRGRLDIAIRWDEHLTRLSGATNAPDRRREAANLLDLVDRIEDLY